MTPEVRLELWKEYEKIAMHFNDLLIQLRLRALAGVGLVTAVTGAITLSNEGADGPNYIAIALTLWFLTVAWSMIWFLDKKYYSRLLSGATDAIIQLEKDSKGTSIEINLSSRIKDAVQKGFLKGGLVYHMFYGVVFLFLFTAALITSNLP